MTFTWYKLFNLSEFPEELSFKIFNLDLEGIGSVAIEAYRGEQVCIYYDGVLLPAMFAGKNPFIGIGGKYAIAQDVDDNIYLGILVE